MSSDPTDELQDMYVNFCKVNCKIRACFGRYLGDGKWIDLIQPLVDRSQKNLVCQSNEYGWLMTADQHFLVTREVGLPVA